jgi:hemolysin III
MNPSMNPHWLDPSAKPKLRGVSHQWAFIVSLFTGAVLVLLAPNGEALLAAGIYALSVAALFGTSALYHRINWRSLAARRWMRRLDHSMIFVLIAGTYTPFALLALDGTLATAILITVWSGAIAGVVLQLVWVDAPRGLSAVVYIAMGWVALAAFPQMVDKVGITGTALVAAGGLLYSVGAGIYAFKRPNPAPKVFGYHEVFHALVILAAALHYAVVALIVVPGAA